MALSLLTRGPFPPSGSRHRRGLMAPIYGVRYPLDFSTISGYYLHLAADFITGVSGGSALTTWNDKSGNQRNATSSGGSRPNYNTNRINGLPAVTFNAAHYMTLGNIPKHSSFTIFCIWNTALTTTRQWVYGSIDVGGDANNAWGLLDFSLSSNNKVNYIFSTGAANSSGNAGSSLMSTNVFALTTQRYTSGANQEEWSKDGTPLTVTTTATAATSNGGTAYEYVLGKAGALGAVYLTGDIAEYIMFSASLSDADRSRVEVYLRTKYAL